MFYILARVIEAALLALWEYGEIPAEEVTALEIDKLEGSYDWYAFYSDGVKDYHILTDCYTFESYVIPFMM